MSAIHIPFWDDPAAGTGRALIGGLECKFPRGWVWLRRSGTIFAALPISTPTAAFIGCSAMHAAYPNEEVRWSVANFTFPWTQIGPDPGNLC